jgi:SAM-dependent methyltransferase
MNQWLGERRRNNSMPHKVIDIGCGTGNTTIALAKHFPDIPFLGIDFSRQSLRAARLRAKKAKISNVLFKRANISQDLSLVGKFKVVLCLGVLHHMEDLESTFRQAVRLMEVDGYLVLWLYGRYGRIKHNLNQSFLKLLTKKTPRSKMFTIARVFIENLGPRFALNSGFYTPKGSGEEGLSWLLKHPLWIADQMIPAFEQTVTLADILHLFHVSNLNWIKWLGIPTQLESYTNSKILLDRFKKLSFEDRLLALDYLLKPAYYFVAGKKVDRK